MKACTLAQALCFCCRVPCALTPVPSFRNVGFGSSNFAPLCSSSVQQRLCHELTDLQHQAKAKGLSAHLDMYLQLGTACEEKGLPMFACFRQPLGLCPLWQLYKGSKLRCKLHYHIPSQRSSSRCPAYAEVEYAHKKAAFLDVWTQSSTDLPAKLSLAPSNLLSPVKLGKDSLGRALRIGKPGLRKLRKGRDENGRLYQMVPVRA